MDCFYKQKDTCPDCAVCSLFGRSPLVELGKEASKDFLEFCTSKTKCWAQNVS